MKLVFGNEGNVAPIEHTRAFFRAAFEAACAELHLDTKTGTVQLDFYKSLGEAEGATDLRRRHPYHVKIGIDVPTNVLPSLVHELIHIRDLETGRMRIVSTPFDALTGRISFIEYDGVTVPWSQVRAYGRHQELASLLPYERTAYAETYPTLQRILKRLPPACVQWLQAQYDATRPATIAALYERQAQAEAARLNNAERGLDLMNAGNAFVACTKPARTLTDLLTWKRRR